jgi:diguanylate cyclase (GGDEF)-like protein
MLRHYIELLQSNWRAIAIVVLAACVLSVLISITATPIYRATTSFIIFPNENLTSSRDVVSSLDTLEKRSVIATYSEIVSSERVYGNTETQMGSEGWDPTAYVRNIQVQPESNIFYLNVDGPDPRLAATLANQIGAQGILIIKGIYQVFDIAILDEARMPTAPISPQPMRSLFIFAVGGLALGMLLVILNYQIRRPIEAIRERINSDPESGAYKRDYFHTLVEQRLAKEPNGALSLALIDLEGLKEFATALPDMVLSDLLQNVTQILKKQLRGNDHVGRWGEATYAIMLPDTPPQPAARTLLRIRQALLVPMEESSRLYRVQLRPSIGLTARENDETLSELLRNVEFALEKANQADNRIYIFPTNLGVSQ